MGLFRSTSGHLFLFSETSNDVERISVPRRDIVVMGASAGGIEAFREILRTLPSDFPAALFIVLHIAPDAPSRLPAILGRSTDLPVLHAYDYAPIEQRRIYVAPPDHHVVLHPDHMRVVRGPRENRHRPAIDPLFRSAAAAFDRRVVGVLLSGLLDDGSNGLQIIHARGGVSVVQDPDDAEFSMMPHSAVLYDSPDWILPVVQIGPLLANLVTEGVEESKADVPRTLKEEIGVAEMNMDDIEAKRAGSPSVFSCPDCRGVLWEVKEGGMARYRCRVGHSYSPDSLMTAKSEELEGALWSALRALEESAAISRRMAERAKQNGHLLSHRKLTVDASDKEQQANMLRNMLKTQVANPQEQVTGTPELRGLGSG
jgi:two-component system, chemotaxis family, protein-glutamate methylesterase/glutaminase